MKAKEILKAENSCKCNYLYVSLSICNLHVMNDSTNLIIDSANLFLRSWSAFPSMDANGEPMGGFIGYVKTLQKLIREIKPKQVFIAWEGGGSSKRRSILANIR